MTSKDLIAQLAIVDTNILAEAALQPQRFMDAAEYRVAKMRKRAQACAELEQLMSRMSLRIRATKDEEGKKLAEGAIKARVETSKRVMVARDVMERAYEEEELSKLLLEAYRMRRDAIRVTADWKNSQGVGEMHEVERIETRRKMVNKARDLESRRRRLGVDADEDN